MSTLTFFKLALYLVPFTFPHIICITLLNLSCTLFSLWDQMKSYITGTLWALTDVLWQIFCSSLSSYCSRLFSWPFPWTNPHSVPACKKWRHSVYVGCGLDMSWSMQILHTVLAIQFHWVTCNLPCITLKHKAKRTASVSPTEYDSQSQKKWGTLSYSTVFYMIFFSKLV